jgi:hypothetical protein
MLGLRRNKGARHTAADVVARARALRPGDYSRWRVLAELNGIDIKTVFDTAAELIDVGDWDSTVLGAEILDGVFTARYREGKRFGREGVRLLRPLCTPEQDPLVLATALHPYSAISPITDPLLFDLLEHHDARVRASVCQLIAIEQRTATDNRITEALIEAVEHDPNDEVRERAADGLVLVYCTDERYKAQIAGALTRYGNDPQPAVRVAAIQATSNDDAGQILARLIVELRAPRVDWRFVHACRGRGVWDAASVDARADATQALTRLREQNWAAWETPGQYPLTDERVDMLAEAIDAVAP